MSTQRGNATRTRSQKHKNRTVFKNDLHDKTNLQKKINSLHVSEVCQHCKDVIEWKIKYKKYKPLTQPKKCTRCEQKNIIKAYHVLCRHCALETHVCAKCLKSEEQVVIEPPQPTMEEQVKLKLEMERLIKSLPERKRRAFIRYMDKGKKHEDLEETISGVGIESDTQLRKQLDDKIILPHTREELIQKIDFLKLSNEDEYIISDADPESDDESPI